MDHTLSKLSTCQGGQNNACTHVELWHRVHRRSQHDHPAHHSSRWRRTSITCRLRCFATFTIYASFIRTGYSAALHTRSLCLPVIITLPVRCAASLPLCTYWCGIRGRCFVLSRLLLLILLLTRSINNVKTGSPDTKQEVKVQAGKTSSLRRLSRPIRSQHCHHILESRNYGLATAHHAVFKEKWKIINVPNVFSSLNWKFIF